MKSYQDGNQLKGRSTSCRIGEGMSLEWNLERIGRAGFIGILRGEDPEALIQRGLRLADAGVRVLEVTLDSNDAAGVFATLKEHLSDDVMLGVGTVMHPPTALPSVAEWGADFALSPVNPEGFIQLANELDILAVPGAATPGELWKAHTAGAMLVKLYPAATNWSPEMLANLPRPLRQVHTLPTGGVKSEDVISWLDAGAFACGLGGQLSVEGADFLSSQILARRGVMR